MFGKRFSRTVSPTFVQSRCPRAAWTVLGLLLLACGGPDRTIMTPQERIAEQERLAWEDEQRAKEREAQEPDTFTPEEEKKAFDEEQMERELVRATRSAETCTGVVKTDHYGETEVTLTFEESGVVKDAQLEQPYADTPLGQCILRAYEAIIVPPYDGGDQIRSWKLEVKKPEKPPKE